MKKSLDLLTIFYCALALQLHGGETKARRGRPLKLFGEEVDNNLLEKENDYGGTSPGEDSGVFCMKKVMLIEQVEYDEQIKCEHATKQNCYQVYKTVFKQTKVEDCSEKFRKDCFIEYRPVTTEKEVEVCTEPVKRDCDKEGEKTVCQTHYETVCQPQYRPNENASSSTATRRKRPTSRSFLIPFPSRSRGGRSPKGTRRSMKSGLSSPRVDCQSMPVRVCRPEVCPLVRAERVCKKTLKHLVQDIPEEHCTLVPVRECTDSVKIVPNLVPTSECVPVSQEVCTTEKVNPRKVKRPVVKKWCGKQESKEEEDEEPVGEEPQDTIDFKEDFEVLHETEETFEFYSHFLLVNSTNQASFITFDADGDNCPLEPLKSHPGEQSRRLGMVLDNGRLLRVCGAVTQGPSGVPTPGNGFICRDYMMITSSDAGMSPAFTELPVDPTEARVQSAMVELAPGRYWITGGIMWENGEGGEGTITRTTSIMEYGKEIKRGPSLPEPLHSHCMVRVNRTHFFLHGGLGPLTGSVPTPRAYLYDAQRQKFSPADPSGSVGFAGHACGVVREGELRVMAVGGGRDHKKVFTFSLKDLKWRDNGNFPHDKAVHDIAMWQMEDTFQVIGVEDENGSHTAIYEYDTGEEKFIRVGLDRKEELPIEVVDPVLLPVPSRLAFNCLRNSKLL